MWFFFSLKALTGINIVNEVLILLYDPCLHFSLEVDETRKLMLGFWSVYIKTKSSISCFGIYWDILSIRIVFLCFDLNKLRISFKSVPIGSVTMKPVENFKKKLNLNEIKLIIFYGVRKDFPVKFWIWVGISAYPKLFKLTSCIYIVIFFLRPWFVGMKIRIASNYWNWYSWPFNQRTLVGKLFFPPLFGLKC